MWIGSIRRALRIHIFPFFLIFLLSFHFYLIFLTPSPHRIVRHIESRTANEFSQFHASLFVALYFHLISLLVAFTYILLFVYFFILVFVLFPTVDRGGGDGKALCMYRYVDCTIMLVLFCAHRLNALINKQRWQYIDQRIFSVCFRPLRLSSRAL